MVLVGGYIIENMVIFVCGRIIDDGGCLLLLFLEVCLLEVYV